MIAGEYSDIDYAYPGSGNRVLSDPEKNRGSLKGRPCSANPYRQRSRYFRELPTCAF